MEKSITVKPMGGLANRMRVIASAYHYALEYQYPVTLIWERSFVLNCPFTRLFKLPDNTSLIEYSRSPLSVRALSFSQKFLRKTGISIPLGHDYYLVGDAVQNDDKVNQLTAHQKVYIETVHKFAEQHRGGALLVPVEELQTSISHVRNNYKDFTLGVHIRRTDNMNSIKFSPLKEFFHVIDQELSKHPDLSIFLATDSLPEEQAMKNRYKDRVMCLHKTLNRNDEKGIRDALVDLYCLAASDKIIGSHYSSFSEVAAQIGNKPFFQIYKDPDD
jgi:hypothetical protein